MLSFKDCEVSVSGSHLIADSASISQENSVSPVYSIRYNGPITMAPNNSIKNRIQIDYTVETNQEPNFYLAKNIRDYVFDDYPVEIIIGGITGNGYLASYNLNIEPNNTIKASVTYNTYEELEGEISNQPASAVAGYNLLNGSGVGHYWTTYAKLGNETATGSLLQGNYSFRASWSPIYTIGQASPSQVKFLNAEENFSFLSEYNLYVTFSGDEFTSKFTDVEMIEINNISSDWSSANNNSLKIYPASGTIVNHGVEFTQSSPILSQTDIVKHY